MKLITITRYPTGVFGISHDGAHFYRLCCNEEEAAEELRKLEGKGIPCRWIEKYYDRRFHFDDPRGYKTREYKPKYPIIV